MSVAAMWFILGIILLAVELVSPVFVLFFFGRGTQAANLRVAENYLEQFGKLAKEGNTMILPTDLANISGLVSSLTSVIKQAKA